MLIIGLDLIEQNLLDSNKNEDLGRMYSLVSRISEGLKELKTVLEEHIHKQGVEVIAQCGDAAINVSSLTPDCFIDP